MAKDNSNRVPNLMAAIRAGDRVTICTPQGAQRTGHAVMRGPAGWVLNMGGAHGTPGIVTEDNTVQVKHTAPRCRKIDKHRVNRLS